MSQNASATANATQPDGPAEDAVDITRSEYYFNRELSHLGFNARVLHQVKEEGHPLLMRLMFSSIFSSNMDEFFEIRVAGLKQQIKFGREVVGPDGMSPAQVLENISHKNHQLVKEQYHLLNNELIPALQKENIHFLRRADLNEEQAAWLAEYFEENIWPVINPIGLDPSHPFPRLVNKSLNFIVELEGKDAFGRETGMAIVPAPRSLPRLVRLPDEICDSGDNMVFLSSIIHAHAKDLFPGMTIKGLYQFRITRNADLVLEEDDMEDLAKALRGELLSRRFGEAVRLEVVDSCPEEFVKFLLQEFGLSEADCYRVDGPVNLMRMMEVNSLVNRPDLHYPGFTAGIPKEMTHKKNYFDVISKQDILLLHPFQSFTPVIDFIRQAASDPNVLAIRQTLYRSGSQSEIVMALVDAARNGKEVTAVVELRARFDEAENLELASRLQEAGVIVVYGVVGYKCHSKMMLVVRKEEGELKHYVHLGTGNYHSGNAKLYTDYSLLTCDDSLGEDVYRLFQQLTGMGKALKIKKLFHAPFTLHACLIDLINREAEYAKSGKTGYILAKMNALTEKKVMEALYRASQAGVKIDLIVRGICCLRPSVPGLSENIRVRSIIGRFLEHTRTFCFGNDGNMEVYASSADWMVRNLLNRVETCFPIEKKELVRRVRSELEAYLKDNVSAWSLDCNGDYQRVLPTEGEESFSAQNYLLAEFAT